MQSFLKSVWPTNILTIITLYLSKNKFTGKDTTDTDNHIFNTLYIPWGEFELFPVISKEKDKWILMPNIYPSSLK